MFWALMLGIMTALALAVEAGVGAGDGAAAPSGGDGGGIGEAAASMAAFLEGGGTLPEDEGGDETGGLEFDVPGEGDEGGEDEGAGSGGTGDDDRSPYIPRARFDEVLNERNTLREQAQSVGALREFADHFGITPDQAKQLVEDAKAGRLQGPGTQQPQQPTQEQQEAAFTDWMRSEYPDVDPQWLTPFELRTARRQFAQERHAQEREITDLRRTVEGDAEAISRDIPALQPAGLRQAFLAHYAATHDAHSPKAMRAAAEKFAAEVNVLTRNQSAENAAADAEARGRPNTGGGRSPGNAADLSFVTDLSPAGESKFRAAVRGIFGAAGRQRR